ncbi:MAG TPA: HAD family acid phosphatase [Gammaproteobacteria bacterium]|nr:HAD family acid phosphatase [Gammaproteobacteria bacterium]
MHILRVTCLPARLRLLAASLLLAVLAACTDPAVDSKAHEMLNATLWQHTSAEYEVAVLQAYRLAQENLDKALADVHWNAAPEPSGNDAGLAPAVLLDLDETVIDNTEYEVRIIRELGQYSPESFAQWCESAQAPAITGAPEFLEYAESRQVAVFYYSARKESLRGCTTRNLQRLGLPLADDTHLLLDDGTSKSEYRRMIAAKYRLLLLVGDNLEDFVEGSKSTSAQRRELASHYARHWGREWIILPNPMYGHWESTTYNFDYRLSRDEQLQRKREALQ